jgi:hypothetical protein
MLELTSTKNNNQNNIMLERLIIVKILYGLVVNTTGSNPTEILNIDISKKFCAN